MVCWEYPDDGSMPTWMPPSPPVSDSEADFYCDPCGQEWYEAEPMCESRLPSTVHELHRPRPTVHTPVLTSQLIMPSIVETEKCASLSVEPVFTSGAVPEPSISATSVDTTTNVDAIATQKPARAATPVFERERINVMPQTGVSNGAAFLDTSNLLRPPTPSQTVSTVDDAIDTVRRSQKFSAQRHFYSTPKGSYAETRSGKSEMRRPFTPPPRIFEASDYEGPEWSIIEDRALLLAVTCDQNLPYHLHSSKSGHIANWEYISAVLLRVSGHYRSPRQCCLRYQMIVIPREEGRTIALDPITKKTKKITVSSVELAHMKRGNTTTEQQYVADASKILSGQILQKFSACKSILARRNSRNHLFPTPILSSLDGSLTSEQQHKLTEYSAQYRQNAYPEEILDCQRDVRIKLREQDKERQVVKEREQQKEKEAALLKERNETNQKSIEKRESIFSSLSGMIKYQRASMAFMEQTSPHISVPVCPPSASTVQYQNAGVRTAGSSIHSLQMTNTNSGMNVNCNSNEITQVVVGQRSYSDHQSNAINAIPNAHHTTTRRVTLPPGALQSTQHQIVMSGGATAVQTGGQPYTVVVAQDSLSGSAQSANTRMQYGNRPESVVEQRQAVYRAVSIGPNKRAPSSSPVQRVGLSTGYSSSGTGGASQIYTTSGRTVIVANQSNEIPTLNEQAQLQNMRPQMQSVVSAGQRQDVRPKISQRTQNRVYITPSGAGSETRSYKLSPGPVRMLTSGQRITQKRSPGVIPGRSLNTPQVTMTVRSGMQQVVGITRTVSAGYQGSRMPSIGVIMSNNSNSGNNGSSSNGGGNVRTGETFAAAGLSRQVPSTSISGQVVTTGSSGVTLPRQYAVNSQGQITRQLPTYSSQPSVSSGSGIRSNSASNVVQDHYVANLTVQQTQTLPPISLSCHTSAQRLNPPSTSAGETGNTIGSVVARQAVSLTNTAPSSSSIQQQSQTSNSGSNNNGSNGHCSETMSSTTASATNNGTSSLQ